MVWHERDHEGRSGETTGRQTPCSNPSCDTNAHASLSKPSSQTKPLPRTRPSLPLLPIQYPRTSVPHPCLLLCLFLVTREGCLHALLSEPWVVVRRTASKILFLWSSPASNNLTLFLERPQISPCNQPQAHPGKLERILHINLNLLPVSILSKMFFTVSFPNTSMHDLLGFKIERKL